jgi:MscS family membrane protein
MFPRLLFAAALALFLAPTPLGAGPGGGGGPAKLAAPAPPPPTPTPAAEVSPDSPRTALSDYFALCNDGHFDDAARYLDLPAGLEGQGPELARKLKAVLDHFLWIDLEKVSALPGGVREDGLPAEVDEVGAITLDHGKREPVRLVRRDRPDGPQWAFSRSTVARVPGWYEALPDRFLRERLPSVFFGSPKGGLLLWQWIAIVAAAPLFLVVGRLLGWGTKRLLVKLAQRTETPWDEVLVRRMTGPVSVLWALALARSGVPYLHGNATGEAFLIGILKALFVLDLIWAFYRAIRVAADAASASEWAKSNPSAPSILTLGVRAGEVTIFALGVVAALSEVGVPVASLVAGLGIGGIALALAAQKTVENLFGSISLGIDQPLRVGDTVKVGDVFGTVELIGLRSTRLRTLDRTVVTIPNGKLADREIESFAQRDRIRLASNLGLVFGTTSAQMRQVLASIGALLKSHPRVWQELVVVRFAEIGPSSLAIEVVAWIETTDYQEFRAVREELLLGFLASVEKAGTSLAFPTRTVHLVKEE